jgi:hypothetical protein
MKTAKTHRMSLFLFLLVVSCSKDTSPTSPTSVTVVKPTVGSSFTFDEYSTDSTHAIITATRDTMVSTVLRTDAVMQGKTGVVVVEDVRAASRDTAFYFYESNGDVSVLGAAMNTGDPMWMLVPIGSGSRVVYATNNTFVSDTFMTVIIDSVIITVVGAVNVTVKGQSISCKKVQMTFKQIVTVNGQHGADPVVDNTMDFAPSIGFMVKTGSPSRPDPFGGWIDGKFQALIDYVVK